MLELIVRFIKRIAPREGWLLWLMALALAMLVAVAANEAAWVPNLGTVLVLVILAAFVAGFVLARLAFDPDLRRERSRRLPGWLAAVLMAVLGLLAVSLFVGWGEAANPAPGTPWYALPAARAELAVVEMAQRLGQWATDVRAGTAVQDDAVFLWILSLLVWAAVIWAAWELFHGKNALAAFLPVGVLVATNAYFYWNGRLWLPFFFGGVTMLIVLAERYWAEQRWQRQGKDFARDIRFDLLFAAGGLAMIVTLASLAMARVVIQPTAAWFDDVASEPLAVIQSGGEQMFPGLRRAPRSLLASGGGSGGMPRAFLLGSGPELSDELVMRVATDELESLPPGQQPPDEMRHYWRALTYDIYTGRGWRNTTVDLERRRAGETWLTEMPAGQRLLRQSVELARGGDRAYYAAGEPLSVNRPYETLVRINAPDPGLELVAVTGDGRRYQVLSAVPTLDGQTLRAAGDVYPAGIAERYLALPDDLPARVADTARQVTANAETPYDQALALQDFLRGFPYDLHVAPPPAGRDVADYFLFDLQSGYCDYYATTMVVMARSLGVPARLAVGYAPGNYDPQEGVFVVTEDLAHSWPELYFPGAGWVPFEPTAAQRTIEWQVAGGSDQYPYGDVAALAATDLQTFREDEIVRQRAGGLTAVLILLLAAAVGVIFWRRRPEPPLEALYQAFGRWGSRLGRPAGQGETPAEFGRGLAEQLHETGGVSDSSDQVMPFIGLFEQAQYGPQGQQAEPLVRERWRSLRARLRRAWLRRKLRKK